MKTYKDLMEFIYVGERALIAMKKEGDLTDSKVKEKISDMESRINGCYMTVAHIYGLEMVDVANDVGDFGKRKEKQKLN